jgi:hypothetical protein
MLEKMRSPELRERGYSCSQQGKEANVECNLSDEDINKTVNSVSNSSYNYN